MQRRILFIALLLCLSAISAIAQSQRMAVLELFTSTTCVFCPRVETWVNAHTDALSSSDAAVEIAWHVWWPAAGDPFYGANMPPAQARVSYYGVSGTPTMIMDGSESAIGTDTARFVANINAEDEILSPLELTLDQSDFTHARIRVLVTGDVSGFEDPTLFLIATEDHLRYGGSTYNGVFREVWPRPTGELLHLREGLDTIVTVDYLPAATWNIGNCKMIAFIQNYSTKEILNGTWQPLDMPGFFLRVDAPVTRNILFEADTTTFVNILRNMGSNDDNLTVALAADALPSGWTSTLTLGGSTVRFPYTLGLSGGDTADVRIHAQAAGRGVAEWSLHVASTGDPTHVEDRAFSVWCRPDMTLVEDDLTEGLAELYHTALDTTLLVADWDFLADGNPPPAAVDASQSPLMIRFTGSDTLTSLTGIDFSPYNNYTRRGGKAVFMGQGIPEDLSTAPIFRTMLHLSYGGVATGAHTLAGVNRTAFGGTAFTLNGPESPVPAMTFPILVPTDTAAQPLLRWSDGSVAAVVIYKGTGLLAIFGFGLEAIEGLANRQAFMTHIMDLFAGRTGVVELEFAQSGSISPNPVTGEVIRVDASGPVEILDVSGRVVARTTISSDGTCRVGSLMEGIYYLRTEDGQTLGPVVKIAR